MNYSSIYKNNGYLIIEKFFDPLRMIEITYEFKDVFDHVLNSKHAPVGDSLYQSMQNLYELDINAYKEVVGQLWRLIKLYDLSHDKSIIDLLRSEFYFDNIFVPGGQIVHIMSSLLTIPNGYFGLGAHQDFHSVQGSLDGLVVWIPLTDVDKNRYPVEIIPGSHLKGPLPQVELETGWIVKPECYNESDFVPVECKVGDIVLISNFTVHRSSQRGDDRLRLAFSSRFDNGVEKSFINRCYPTGYKRSVHRQQLHDVSSYFLDN
jgi:hypothetical protein